MTLSRDEREDMLRGIIRCNIDLNQAANYFLNSKYDQGYSNLSQVIEQIKSMLVKVNN